MGQDGQKLRHFPPPTSFWMKEELVNRKKEADDGGPKYGEAEASFSEASVLENPGSGFNSDPESLCELSCQDDAHQFKFTTLSLHL